MNLNQKKILLRILNDQDVDSVPTHCIASMFTVPCTVCHKDTLYPTAYGIGPEVQGFPKEKLGDLVYLCDACKQAVHREATLKNLRSELS